MSMTPRVPPFLPWRGVAGCYNLVENDSEVSAALARYRLGWQPGFRLQQG
jgi:hypothetical protein